MTTLHRTLPLALALAATACESGLSGPIGDPMSRDEAVVVAGGIVIVSEGAAKAVAGGSDGMASVLGFDRNAGTFGVSRQGSYACPGGGEVQYNLALDGSLDEASESVSFDAAGHQKHAGCSFTHEALTFAVTGAPRLVFSASGEMLNGEPAKPFRFKAEGALDWTASDGRSGRCPIKVDVVADMAAGRKTADALICGHTFTQTEIDG